LLKRGFIQVLLERVQSSEFRVQSSEFRVQSSEFRVQSSEFRVKKLDSLFCYYFSK